MMAKKTNNQGSKKSITFASVILFVSILAVAMISNVFFATADPDGALLTYIGNSTKGTVTPGNRSDPGGYINTMNLASTQQNSKWKAYVGNVSGSLTLDDSSANTIYDWAISTITGEVFASRASSITWGSIACASTGQIEAEDTGVGFTPGSADTVNSTFNETVHATTIVAGTSISNSTCRSTATFVSDARQAASETMDFQEFLLYDSSSLVYATILEDDATGYDAAATYDFQMIVPDNETSQNTQYFFYAELG